MEIIFKFKYCHTMNATRKPYNTGFQFYSKNESMLNNSKYSGDISRGGSPQ